MSWNAKLEKSYPLLGALAVVALWLYFSCPFPEPADALLGAAATVASVLASFLGVSKAIILSIRSSDVFLKIEELGYKDQLFSFLSNAIYASILFAVISILGFFVSSSAIIDGHHDLKIYQLVWVGASIYALLSYLRISSVLFKMLKQV